MAATCPLCSNPPAATLNRFRLDEVAEHFTPQMTDSDKFERMKGVLANLWQSDEVRIMRCDACEFGFADPFVAGTAEFYELEAPDTPYPKDKWEYQRALRSLQPLSTNGARLIDIGAGKGYFLSHLLDRGWKPGQLAATEFSTNGKAAIERLGIECFQSDIRSLDQSNAFDVICMFQVLEHLDQYDALLDAIARLGRPGAHLFVAVPNGHRVDFNEQVGLQWDFPPNHLSRWTPKSFQVLAAKYGWSVEECELEPPATVPQEVVYGAVNRYLRNSHTPGSWARLTYGVADRTFARSSKANKMVKAFGMALSPDAWRAAIRVAARSRGGGIPHSLWLHLRRQDPPPTRDGPSARSAAASPAA